MSDGNEVDEPISEEWLRAAGFRWHQLDRQPDKHWLLWLGHAMPAGFLVATEDIGIELAPSFDGTWFCWLRSDVSHRYGRFIHIRHLFRTGEVIRLIEALTGQGWNPSNNLYGTMLRPDDAERAHAELARLDRAMLSNSWGNWHEAEKDPHRGGPLLDHMHDAIDAGKAK